MTSRSARGPVRARALLISALAPALAALLAGCVSLPTNSAVIKDTSQPTSNGGEDVRLWPAHGPHLGDDPYSILEGFLQTAASDEPDPEPAKQYLTGSARDTWDSKKVLVFSSETAVAAVPGSVNEFEITGIEVGWVDDEGHYSAVPNPTSQAYFFHVGGDDKTGYRIDSLPPDFGIALTQEAFRQYYTPYSVYYLDKQAQKSSMIPVPVYKRTALADQDTAKQLAGALLSGAPPQYETVAEVAATSLNLSSVSISQSDVAQITLKPQTLCTAAAHGPCDQLAEELLATFLGVGSISSVQVFDQAFGPQKPIGQASNVDAVLAKYHVTINVQRPDTADLYYLVWPQAKGDNDAGHIFRRPTGKNAVMVGPTDRKYGQVAVDPRPRPGAPTLALVDAGGQNLYLAAATAGAPATPVFSGPGISSLTWDAFGHVWFIASPNGTPALYRVDTANSQLTPHEVTVELPQAGDTLQQVSVAPDGHRLAVAYKAGNGYALSIGVELNSGAKFHADLADGSSQPILAGWATVSDLKWNSSQSVVILGAPQSSEAPSITAVYTDGSPVYTLPDLNAVTITPPISTSSIAWTTTGRLIAAYKGTGDAQQIAEYSPSNDGWETETAFSGISPSYGN